MRARGGGRARLIDGAGHVLPWLLLVVAFFAFPDFRALGNHVIIMILFTLSLDLALGYAGIVTLGHAAFFGAGAYAAGIIAINVTGDPLIGLVAATVIAGILGLLSGIMILHTHGVTLLMLTLAIGSILYEVANTARSWTGGDDGLFGIRMDPILGLWKFDLWSTTAYVYSGAVLLCWFLAARIIVKSPFGRSLDGIRQNTARMRAIGTPVWRRLVAVYTLAAAMAGTAGALSAQTTKFVGLSTLALFMSGIVAVMLVLGGTRRLYGAFVGAAVYAVVQNFAAEINPFYWMFVIGGMLILVVLFLEGGLMSLVDKVRGQILRGSGEDGR